MTSPHSMQSEYQTHGVCRHFGPDTSRAVGGMSLVETCKRFARPSVVCDKRDLDRIHAACEVLRWGQRVSAEAFIRRHADRTLVMQYGSDVTPLVTKEQYRRECGGASSVVRGGHSCQEFLIQRLFLESGAGNGCCVLAAPLPMQKKTAFAHFSAYRALLRTPRELGHTGLCVIFQKFDRALQTAMSRLARQWQAAYDDRAAEEQPAGQSYRLWLTNWYMCVGCFAHDVHGGLRWAICSITRDKDTLKSCFLTHESLRHGYDLLAKHVLPWVRSRLTFDDWAHPHIPTFFEFLGLQDEWLALAVELEIRFTNGRLCIAQRHRRRHDLIDVICTLLLHVWRFRRFSESRFATMGRCSRTLILAETMGLTDLVEFVLAKGESQYYLGGFVKHFGPEVRRLTCIVGMGSHLSDSVLAMILADDRLPLLLPHIDSKIIGELDKVVALPMPIWDVVGSIAAVPGASLRGATIAAATTSAGYIHGHLRSARRGAWALLGGDRCANLKALASGPCPEHDEVMFKIWEMMRLGMGVGLIVEGLEALSRCSWTTMAEEQGHVAASSLMRLHRQYGVETLQGRAMVLQCRPLFAPSKIEKQIRQKEIQLQAVSRKQVRRISGRQLFLRDLHRETGKLRSSGRAVPSTIVKSLFAKHGKRWRALTVAQRRRFDARVRAARDDAEEAKFARMATLSQDIQDLKGELARARPEGRPQRVSDCKLSASTISELELALASPSFSKARVAEMRKAAAKPFAAAPAAALRGLESIDVSDGTRRPPALPWVRLVASQRDFFASAIFQIHEPSGSSFWKFVFAKQSPIVLCAVALTPQDMSEPLLRDCDASEMSSNSWDHSFLINWSQFHFSDDGVWQVEWPCSVLRSSCHCSGKRVCADGDWMPMEVMQSFFPKVPELARDVEKKTQCATFEHDIYTQNPWLAEYMKWGATSQDGSGAKPAGRRSAKQPGGSEHQRGDRDEFVDAEVVMEALLRKKLELDLAAPPSDSDFQVSLRGGQWLYKTTGKEFDSVRGEAHTADAVTWCAQAGMQKTFTAAIDSYGDKVATSLCRAWASKMQYLFDLYRDEGPDIECTKEVLRDWEEPPDLQECYSAGHEALRRRVDQIRAMAPRPRFSASKTESAGSRLRSLRNLPPESAKKRNHKIPPQIFANASGNFGFLGPHNLWPDLRPYSVGESGLDLRSSLWRHEFGPGSRPQIRPQNLWRILWLRFWPFIRVSWRTLVCSLHDLGAGGWVERVSDRRALGHGVFLVPSAVWRPLAYPSSTIGSGCVCVRHGLGDTAGGLHPRP